jgi:ribosomal protein L20A (L18A)
MKYNIEARVKIKDRIIKIKKEIEANSKKMAEQIFITKVGADHGVKKSQIKILEILEEV